MVIGVCGYTATGSSTVSDLLQEFEETQVLDSIEFSIAYFPDGLEDLYYQTHRFSKYTASIVAAERFMWLIKKHRPLRRATKGKAVIYTQKLLNSITWVHWLGYSGTDLHFSGILKRGFKKALTLLSHRLHLLLPPKIYQNLLCREMRLAEFPKDFDTASKDFIGDILDAMGRNLQKITVLDQPFEGCDPVKSFKFFDNPKAIVVDRDPRDHYLFAKKFLRERGAGYQIPCDNVDDYMKYYRLIRQSPNGLREREDVLFLNFEQLVYDYENTVKKIADFCGVKEHTRKGECFKPTHSRSNTQLFKKYTGFEEDIAKIERELSEYLFHFENYPDIEPEGGMFFGSQNRKRK
jgi:hypothetical protein